MVIFYHASVRNVKKKYYHIYIYVELCYSENEIFHIFTYITADVRQTAKDTEFNYFLSYSTQNCIYVIILGHGGHFGIPTASL